MARPTHIGNTTYGFGRVTVGVGDDPDAPTGDAPTPDDVAPESSVEIPVGVFESAELNVAHGTMTSGQSGPYGPAPANPTNANDDVHDTASIRSSFSGSGGAAIAWWWQTDLATSYIVTSLEAYDPVSDYGWATTFTTLVEGSANGTDWTSLAYSVTSGTYANNGVGGGTRDKTIYTLDDPAQYRYWRIRKTHNTTGFEDFDATAEIKVYGQEASDLAWIAATLVKDDDDATFEYVTEEAATEAGAVLRLDVGTAQRFASFRLVIGTEDAGSVEYALEGSNSSDFTGAVELAAVTFTATGSFTADTVTASWSQSTGYRYYRLVPTTPDDVRIYTFSLYPAPDPGEAIDDHLTDSVDAHDASAISFTPAGTIAATNVQAAIEEVASEAGGGTPATTVENETTYGITPAVGTDTEYARQDHTHGTPAVPDLDDLGDVNAPTPSDGDVLAWDSTPGEWVPVAPGTPTLDYGEDADISTLDYDDVADAGVLDEVARADHVHGMPSAGGGGGLTQAYAGYNTVGGSWESPGVNAKTYWKSITLANDCLITSIGAYVRHASGSAKGIVAALYSDSSAPLLLIGHSNLAAPQHYFTANTARWVEVPLGIWVTAGTYWVAIRTSDTGGSVVLQIAYDATGSDRTATGTANVWSDYAAYSSPTTTSNQYSIRANTIR